MNHKSLQTPFVVGVISSLAAGALTAIASWFVSQSWAVVACVGLAWTGFVVVIAVIVRRSYIALRRDYEEALLLSTEPNLHQVTFVPRMSKEEAQARIRSAKREIWSFQISGSEFTASSIDSYKAWLSADRNRTLLIAFADPENTGLLKNIVKLSGVANLSTEDHAYTNLRTVIRTTLDRYTELRQSYGDQVDVRVYDFSPPYSFHAIDPDDEVAGSGFVELYLPDLPSADRPCMLLPYDHAKFSLYRNQSLAWFEAGTRALRPPEPSGRQQDPAAP